MYGGERLVEVMLHLVMSSMSSPTDWKRSQLVHLHKDGDNEEVGNYRGIALSCSWQRHFEGTGEEVGKIF